ncbi:MAG: hypothetical protein ACOYN5_07990 [Bacteroidales bacterium]
MKSKISFKGYYQPTPKNVRRFGDALLGVSTFVSGYAMIEEYVTIAVIFLIVGAVGKFLTNFFTEN